MRVSIEIGTKTKGYFRNRCSAAIRNVANGTKKATTKACEEILADSLSQVPRNTNTLANSAFYEVGRRTDTSPNTWAYEAVIGYGGNGNPYNAKSKQYASEYMVEVHEDLFAEHPNGGKAKFLEDPVRAYSNKFKRTTIEYISDEIDNTNRGG